MSNLNITTIKNAKKNVGILDVDQMPYKRHSQDIAEELKVVRGVLADYERRTEQNADTCPSTLFAIHCLKDDLKWLEKQFIAAELHEKQQKQLS
jgi:hypothetical protein